VTTDEHEEPTMDARLDYFADPTAGKVLKYFMSAGKVLKAAAAGETPVRLNLVTAWREATVFTEAERAALALAEEGTRVADAAQGVGDEVWAHAAKHYDGEQLTALVMLVSFMNAVNRLNVITRQPAGAYEPGQFH
jgi:hypothetical protein